MCKKKDSFELRPQVPHSFRVKNIRLENRGRTVVELTNNHTVWINRGDDVEITFWDGTNDRLVKEHYPLVEFPWIQEKLNEYYINLVLDAVGKLNTYKEEDDNQDDNE